MHFSLFPKHCRFELMMMRCLFVVFTKCKESLQDGRRLENISWRLWYREMMLASEVAALRRSSSSAEGLVLVVVEDEKGKETGDVWSSVSSESSLLSSPSLMAPPPAYSSSSSSMVSLSSSSMLSLLGGSSLFLFFFCPFSILSFPLWECAVISFICLLWSFLFAAVSYTMPGFLNVHACISEACMLPCLATQALPSFPSPWPFFDSVYFFYCCFCFIFQLNCLFFS